MNKKVSILVILILIILAGGFYYLKNIKQPADSLSNIEDETEIITGTNIINPARLKNGTEYLVDNKGMTLYVYADDYKADKKVISVCTLECIKDFPPYMIYDNSFASSTDIYVKRLNFVKRIDAGVHNTHQFAYYEKPLYHYKGDLKLGDKNGIGLSNGKWTRARAN